MNRCTTSAIRLLAFAVATAWLGTTSLPAQLIDPGIVIDPDIIDPDIIGPVLPPIANIDHPFERGDANQDGSADVSDGVFTLNFLFVSGSSEPTCMKAADVNDDGVVDISDPMALLGFMFLGSPTIPPPVGACGFDPTPDQLGCATRGPCEVNTGCGLDLAASISVQTVTCFNGSARIRIRGEATNISSQDFRSRLGPQSLLLYEVQGRTRTLVASKDFTAVQAGFGVDVSYERLWILSTEFPPSYEVRLSYDPDIFIDANEENDDCDLTNNDATITPAEIRAEIEESC